MGEIRKLFGLLAMLVLASASPAHAEWRRVRTDHFVLTIDDTEEGARDFATRLERFDAAMRLLYNVADTPDRRARPITIYSLKEAVFYGACGCPGVLGYYRQRIESSYIFSLHMPKIDPKSKPGSWSSQTVLLHEYGHHFLYSNFPIAYPYWFSEGFAEFNAASSFEADGSLILGYPANYRAGSLLNSSMSPKMLFDPERYGFDNMDLLYGRGWLLTHYLTLRPDRKGQLATYLGAMNRGRPSLEAAKTTFGDLEQLNDQLDVYRKGDLAAPLRIPPPKEPISVSMTTLSEGEGEMLPVYLSALDGVWQGSGRAISDKATRVAKRYPDDAMVQAQHAEVEYYARRFDKAEAAVDRALALKPDLPLALLYKGIIATALAREAKATDPAVWTAARRWLLKANRADPNQVGPLYHYYASFVAAKAKPTPDAIKALMRAAVLAPESRDVRYALARQLLLDGDGVGARAALQPIAFTPHLARKENVPRQILALIDAGKIEEAKALMTREENEDED